MPPNLLLWIMPVMPGPVRMGRLKPAPTYLCMMTVRMRLLVLQGHRLHTLALGSVRDLREHGVVSLLFEHDLVRRPIGILHPCGFDDDELRRRPAHFLNLDDVGAVAERTNRICARGKRRVPRRERERRGELQRFDDLSLGAARSEDRRQRRGHCQCPNRLLHDTAPSPPASRLECRWHFEAAASTDS